MSLADAFAELLTVFLHGLCGGQDSTVGLCLTSYPSLPHFFSPFSPSLGLNLLIKVLVLVPRKLN